MRACKALKFSKKVANSAPHQLEWTIAVSQAHEFSNKLANPHKSQKKRTIVVHQPPEFSNRQHKGFTRGSFWTARASAALELSKRPPGSHQPSPTAIDQARPPSTKPGHHRPSPAITNQARQSPTKPGRHQARPSTVQALPPAANSPSPHQEPPPQKKIHRKQSQFTTRSGSETFFLF